MKTNLDSIFKTNKEMEKDGIWFEIGDTGFLVKRFSDTNMSVKAAYAKYIKPYLKQIELGTLDSAKEKEIMARVFVEACLIDWKGVEIDGKEAAFDKEVAVKLLGDMPELLNRLQAHASDFQNYKEELGKD